MARAADSWRTEDARHRSVRAHRLPNSPNRPPTQTWKTFLHNHLGQLVSIDFFTVPTVTMKVLFVFILLEHRRRQVLHFNVTEHPTAAWTSQQIVEAFADRDAPRYLYAIGTASTATTFVGGSRHCTWKRYSLRPGVPGRIHMPNA